ncbi:MAG: Ig-like domain-containing protein, partial [Cloacibacillus porcorum]|uniref:Ig-like domain-containing protein n=1 Tax=Cloacibacillus porcorum TaxID=1197717 RepID=UPI002355F760
MDDDSVVTLENNNGKITVVGVRAGTANVTATGKSSGSVGKCVVTVRKTDPVSVTPANMELKIGETGKVKAKYYVEDSVSWSSSNEDVATVKDGTVTAGKKAGVAIITAKGLYTSAACTLTVIDPVTPDPTPTPAPVDPGTVGKEKNPVNNEKDKPENVEAATPAIKEATEDAKDDISNTTNIKKENLVATANGTLTISPVLAKSALEEVMSADKEVAPKNVVLLP